MTWEEFLAWSPGGKTEWVDGRGIAYVANSAQHVQLVVFLSELIGRFLRVFELGIVFADTMVLRLPLAEGHRAGTRRVGRMPDLFVVGRDDLDRVHEQWFDGSPLLAIEIVSDESAERDLIEKRVEYERAGVREYVALDTRPGREGIAYFRLDADGRFQPVGPDENGRYHSGTLPGFWLDLAWFRLETLPEVDDLLLQMAPDVYEAWLLARIRARRGAAGAP
jgi:Uma2 family endonuclease